MRAERAQFTTSIYETKAVSGLPTVWTVCRFFIDTFHLFFIGVGRCSVLYCIVVMVFLLVFFPFIWNGKAISVQLRFGALHFFSLFLFASVYEIFSFHLICECCYHRWSSNSDATLLLLLLLYFQRFSICRFVYGRTAGRCGSFYLFLDCMCQRFEMLRTSV